jgi:hypothetical protein
MTREKTPWIKFLEGDQICNNFWGQLVSYEFNGTLGFRRFLLLQKIWSFNGLVNAR